MRTATSSSLRTASRSGTPSRPRSNERAPWTITYRIDRKDGETRSVWERGIGVRDEKGGLLYLEGFVSDITELRRTEDALREREQMVGGLVRACPARPTAATSTNRGTRRS